MPAPVSGPLILFVRHFLNAASNAFFLANTRTVCDIVAPNTMLHDGLKFCAVREFLGGTFLGLGIVVVIMLRVCFCTTRKWAAS